MKILSIESSCDETSAAVVEKRDNQIIVHSNITATSLPTHAKTGGIIPENAAREQVKYIIPVVKEALLKYSSSEQSESRSSDDSSVQTQTILENDIDAIAVTYGPGLIGSLLVGVETAKTLSFVFNKPLIPVNHLLAHLFANCIDNPNIKYPFIGLIVSGGHTDLLYFRSITEYEWLGGTRDDAAGEALDKIGRQLGLPYPAGPEIEQRAKFGSKTKIRFHAPLLGQETFDFSFSGLKTEVMRFVSKDLRVANGGEEATTGPAIIKPQEELINEICFAVQKAIIDVLVRKTLKAAEEYDCKTILLGGGGLSKPNITREIESRIKNHESRIKDNCAGEKILY